MQQRSTLRDIPRHLCIAIAEREVALAEEKREIVRERGRHRFILGQRRLLLDDGFYFPNRFLAHAIDTDAQAEGIDVKNIATSESAKAKNYGEEKRFHRRRTK